jgi:hypothetical protein
MTPGISYVGAGAGRGGNDLGKKAFYTHAFLPSRKKFPRSLSRFAVGATEVADETKVPKDAPKSTLQNKVVLRCVAGPDVVQSRRLREAGRDDRDICPFCNLRAITRTAGWPGRPAPTVSIAQSTMLFAGRLRNRHAPAGAGHGVRCRKPGITDTRRDTPQAHLEPERCPMRLESPPTRYTAKPPEGSGA